MSEAIKIGTKIRSVTGTWEVTNFSAFINIDGEAQTMIYMVRIDNPTAKEFCNQDASKLLKSLSCGTSKILTNG